MSAVFLVAGGIKVMTKLEPCPFCGGEAEIHEREESMSHCVETQKEIPQGARVLRCVTYPDRNKHKRYYEYREKVYIPRCCRSECVGRLGKQFRSKADAEAAWNRRVDNGH